MNDRSSPDIVELADRLALAADKPELLTTIDLKKVMIEAVRALRAYQPATPTGGEQSSAATATPRTPRFPDAISPEPPENAQ